VCAILMLAVSVGEARAVETVQFNRDIRPILADHCFHCHGPDSASRKAELRLDEEAAMREVVEAGDAAASELIARIPHTDREQRMPPADAEQPLSQDEIALLTRWVEQGAKWEKHWAFVPPAVPALPQVQKES